VTRGQDEAQCACHHHREKTEDAGAVASSASFPRLPGASPGIVRRSTEAFHSSGWYEPVATMTWRRTTAYSALCPITS